MAESIHDEPEEARMKPRRTLVFYLSAVGFGLVVTGFVLSLLLGFMDVSKEGPAGMVVAIPIGIGLCVLILALLLRTIAGSTPPEAKSNMLSVEELQSRNAAASVRQAKIATCFSVLATLLAFVLFFGGIPVAFIGFDFASGTNGIGLIMMLTGLVVAGIAVLSGPIALFLGAMSARRSGDLRWLLLAIALPVVQGSIYLFGTYLTK